MNVEIINVGTELLLGEIINTNATYLQKMCKELGFNVYFQTVVGDNQQRLLDCLDIAFKRGANCVITTGGLGPTQDDLTKELSAKYLGLELEYLDDEAKKVNDKCCFVTGLNHVSDNNFKQAYFPKDCYILENEVGTANGCVMTKDEKMIINLPGPPKEMTYVVEHELIPYLEKYRQDKIYTCDLVTMGIGESKVAELLEDIIQQQKDISIALYASEETVRVRLACQTGSQEQANVMMQPLKDRIQDILGDYILDNPNLFEAVEALIDGYTIDNQCHFSLSDHFIDNHGSVHLTLAIEKHRLGEIVHVNISYFNRNVSLKIPLLKEASLSRARLESRIIKQIYMLVK